MSSAARDRRIPAGLMLGALVLAVLQRPGTLVVDTKLNLYTDPGAFLRAVASAWSPTADLGHVWAGQYGGYLFPMAPWFAAGHALGLPMWLVQRLWLGLLLALAAWGAVRLLDALGDRRRGALHLVAGALYVVNPYVAVLADRTSVSLLAYAALPWMLLLVHRGLRDPRSWRWPAAFALVLTSTGGGVNAAVTAWVLVGPLLFVAYERWFGGVGPGAVRPFALRMLAANALASAWWVVPLAVHTRYGVSILPFSEQPGTIWATTSLAESLRLMGFWTSYVATGYGGTLHSFAGHAHVFLFDTPVVIATLLVPGLALTGFAWTRRWRYGPWFLALTLFGLLVMTAGFPEGTASRSGLTFIYNHVTALQFLRTTYKAGPLVALGLACLAGGAFAELWRRFPRRSWRIAAGVAAAGLAGLAAWPLTTGRAPERQLALAHGVPPAWHAEGRLLTRRGSATRALSLPGQLFAFYRWGGTIDNVLTGLTSHPVATRYIVPQADTRSTDLLWSTDALISDEDALPGQLPTLLDLLGVGDVVLGADGDRSRSGELGAGEVAGVLAGQGLLGRGGGAGPAARGVTRLGARVTVQRAAGRPGGPVRLPRITDIRTPTAGLVRVLPRAAPTIVDGAAAGVAALAGFGALDLRRPIAYAADQPRAALRTAARAGAVLVVSDSNRRQAFVASRLRNDRGQVLAADQDVSQDGAILDPFPAAGTNAQTVAELTGVRSLSSPFSPLVTQFPEHRPYAAMDGDLSTAWLADRNLAVARRHLDVRFLAARDVPYVDLVPYADARGSTRAVAIAGRRYALHAGVNRLRLGLRHVSGLSVLIASVSAPATGPAGAGGIRELRIPGVRVHERLRPPVVLSDALRGADIARSSLTYLFDRFTAAAPAFAATGSHAPWQAALVADRRDPEPRIERRFAVPVARSFAARAWSRAAIGAADDALDRLAGYRGPVRADGSARFENRPGYRASSALDGDPASAWIAAWTPGQHAWLTWRTPTAERIGALRLVAPRPLVRRPTLVRVTVDGHASAPLPVGPDGTVAFPPVRGRSVRLDILRARFPAGTPGRALRTRAVGLADIRGAPRLAVARTGRLAPRCLAVASVDGRVLRMGPRGSIAGLDAGRPVALLGCGAPVALAAGPHDLAGLAAPLALDHLGLFSAAPAGLPTPPAAGRVLSAGHAGNGTRTGVRVDVTAPAWLVLGESYDRGWRATCDGRDLGAPTPLEGFANAWPVERGCRSASFSFAPNRLLWPFYLLSLLAALAWAALLVAQRRRRVPEAVSSALPGGRSPLPWPARRALALAVVVLAVAGFAFSLRAGGLMAVGAGAIAWRGVPTGRLLSVAAVLLLVALPIAQLLGPHEHSGRTAAYAVDRLDAHWVALAACALLGVALARALAVARRAPVESPRCAD